MNNYGRYNDRDRSRQSSGAGRNVVSMDSHRRRETGRGGNVSARGGKTGRMPSGQRYSSLKTRQSNVQKGNSPARSGGWGLEDERARARARARKKKRRRQRRILFAVLFLLVLALIGAAVYGVMLHQREKKKQELLAEGAELIGGGSYEEAITCLDEALQWSGDEIGEFEANVLLYRADAEFRLGDYNAALDTYNILRKSDEDREEYKKGAAYCMVKLGDYDSALTLGVIDGYIYNLKALEQINAEEYDAALEWIAKGKAAGDSQQDLAYNEAVIWENKGDFAKALELFEAYAASYGSDEIVDRELTFLRSRQDNNEESPSSDSGTDDRGQPSAGEEGGTSTGTRAEQSGESASSGADSPGESSSAGESASAGESDGTGESEAPTTVGAVG